MLPDGRRLGAHLPLGGGMVRAVERAHAIGASALQVFSDNPTAWRRRDALPRELPLFRQRLDELDIGPVAIHAAYLVNLAGDDPLFRERSIAVLSRDLETAAAYGARWVNVHIGSHVGAGPAAGAARVADAVAAVLADARVDGVRPALVLENSAGSGSGLGATLDEIDVVARSIAAAGVDDRSVAFCLDTAHAWAAGIDVSAPPAVDAFLDEWDGRIGLDRLVMVHLNDARAPLGARLDRHQHIGAGEIGEAGLRHVLTHPRLGHVTYYLETPGMDEGYDAVNVSRALDLAAGRPLAPLPPEALTLRRSRSRPGPAEEGGPDDRAA